MNMRLSWILFFLLLPCTSAVADDRYPPFKIGMSYEAVSSGLDITPTNFNSEKLTYRPAVSGYFGVILGYRWLSGTI